MSFSSQEEVHEAFPASAMSQNDSEGEWEEINSASDRWEVVSAVESIKSVDTFISSYSGNKKKQSYKDILLNQREPMQVSIQRKMKILSGGSEKKSINKTKILIDEPNVSQDILESSKPLSDKNRAKHERSGRRQYLKGHTGRRQDWFNPDQRTYLIERDEKNVETSLDVKIGGGIKRYRKGKVVCVKNASFNHSHGWEELPKLLEEESCAAPKTVREDKNDGFREVTVYEIKPCSSTKAKVKSSDPDEEERSRCIFFVPPPCSSQFSAKFIPRKIFAKVTRDPPYNILGQPLAWTMRGFCRDNTQVGGKRGKPVLHGNISWNVEDDSLRPGPEGRKVLEIDFGESRVVTAVSTQGGTPPVRTYPSVTLYDSKGNRLPRGQCKVEGHLQEGKYDGPFWNVFNPEVRNNDGAYTRHKLRWVRKYELLWRADRGRQWNMLGVFDANDDTTTEKAHSLTGFHGGQGVLCRYLRFIPIDSENGGAMRVGVYGRELGAGEHDGSEATVDDVLLQEESVEYRLYHPAALKADGTLQRDVMSFGKDTYWDYRTFRSRRRKLKEQARMAKSSSHFL